MWGIVPVSEAVKGLAYWRSEKSVGLYGASNPPRAANPTCSRTSGSPTLPAGVLNAENIGLNRSTILATEKLLFPSDGTCDVVMKKS